MASIPVQMMIEIATEPPEGILYGQSLCLRKLSEGYKLSHGNLVGIGHVKEWGSSIPAKEQEEKSQCAIRGHDVWGSSKHRDLGSRLGRHCSVGHAVLGVGGCR